MIPGRAVDPVEPDIRGEAMAEASRVLRRRSITVGIESGDYAAKIVMDDAVIVANLADDGSTSIRIIAGHLYERMDLLNDIEADDHDKLVAYLEDHAWQRVGRALEDYRAGNR